MAAFIRRVPLRAATLLAVMMVGGLVLVRREQLSEDVSPVVEPTWAEAESFTAARDFSGRIVWASNRSGNHEIYLLDLREEIWRLYKLTRHPHVDTFPRFSPDGSRILFNRSREPGVSFRDPEPWDVWLMSADGSEKRRVAEFGYHANFDPAGRSAIFSRAGQVVRVSLDDGREEVLLDAYRKVGGAALEPDLRGDLLAATVRGGRRAFGVYDLGRDRFRPLPGAGCQIGWWPGSNRLVWVESEGHGGNRIVTTNAVGDDRQILIDLPGSHSHEYFPRLDRRGKWLVFGASAGGHEHDQADYEIFLWRIGTPWERALRLTHHPGNDQNPDVYEPTG